MDSRDKENIAMKVDDPKVEAPALSAEEQAAIDRGDVFVPPEEKKVDLSEFDPDVLKNIAEEEKPLEPIKKDDETFIPKARLDELSQQVKTTREENARLRDEMELLKTGKLVEKEPAEEKINPRLQLKDLREQIRIANIEGDSELAGELEDQRDELLIQIAKDDLNGERNKSDVATSLQEVAADSYKLYPFLNNQSEDADPDAILSVRTRRDELAKEGKPLVEALKQAIAEKGPRFAKLNGIPVKKEEPDLRDAEALRRSANASLAQPATLQNKVDTGSFAIDIDKMTDKQYLAQPEEVKAKLRGDIL